MAEQVYGNVTIKGFVIGPVVVNDYVLGVIKNADNDYALQIKRGGEEQMIPVVSPMLTTEAIEGGTRVTIEDISGTRSFDILNGKDGQDGANGKDGIDGKDGANGIDGQDGKDGKDGKDGVSPVVAVTEIENGHRVTITDAEGEKTFDVLNGGGMPEGGEPYQQLVTDGEGNTVWEDRLAYIRRAETVVMPEQTVNIKATTYIGYCNDEPMQPMLFGNSDGSEGDIKIGRTYILTIDGVEYKCVAKYGINWSNSPSVFFGNASIGADENDSREDTGEPFMFAPTYIDQVYTLLMRREDIGEHTISLREEIVTTKYIDAALLAPESGVNKMLVTDAAGATTWENKLTQEALAPLIAQTTVNMELDSDNGMCFAQIADVDPKLARDVKYKVSFAGMDYECEAKVAQGILYLGSHPASVQQGFANPPFCVAEETEGTFSIFATEEYRGEKEFALYEMSTKILPEYLAAEHGANKMLVTDATGESRWEEKLAYTTKEYAFTDTPKTITFTTDDNGYADLLGWQKMYMPRPSTAYLLKDNGAFYTATSSEKYLGDSPADCPVQGHHNALVGSCWAEFKDAEGNAHCVIISGITAGQTEYTEFHNFPANTTITIEFGQGGEVETIKPLDLKYLPEGVPFVQAALVGQTVVVKAVDSEGKPTEWEAVEQFSGDYNDLTNKPENPDGLPANPAPYQQLVTDSEGAVVWEYRPFGDTITYPVVADNIEANFVDFRNGVVQSSNYQLFSHNDGFEGDMKYIVTIDGESYTATGSEMERTNVANGNAPAEGEIPIGWASEYLGAGTYGLYFRYYGTAGTHTVTIKYERIDINTLDDKYLSYNIPRRDEVGRLARYYLQNNYNEDWVFVLEDGTEVTKKVSIL